MIVTGQVNNRHIGTSIGTNKLIKRFFVKKMSLATDGWSFHDDFEREMKRSVVIILQVLFFMGAVAGCGINTSKPVYPIFSSAASITPPAIISVTPVEIKNSEQIGDTRIAFDIAYYVTNRESGFQGYNLYITAFSTSNDSVSSTGRYLPMGIEPSFPHAGQPASTETKDLKKQRVLHYKAPPSPQFFQKCNTYYFRLQAVADGGLYSNYSPQKSACAKVAPTDCPITPYCP